jgi:multiple sugar transport system permease protein
MGLLGGPVGKNRAERRRWIAFIYATLIAGGVTMIYPFLVMISGSFKSEVDIRTYDMVPAYFHDDAVLFRKYLESKYNESVSTYNTNVRQDEFSFMHVNPPAAPNPTRAADYREFLSTYVLSPYFCILGHATSVNGRMLPENARGFRRWMSRRCHGSLDEFNQRYGGLTTSWLTVSYPNMNAADRSFKLNRSPLLPAAYEFMKDRRFRDLVPLSLDGRYVKDYLQLKYGTKIGDYNRAHGTRHAGWDAVFLPATVPAGGLERKDWLDFTRIELNVLFMKMGPEARGEYAAFLEKRYSGSLNLLNRRYLGGYKSFSSVPYPRDLLVTGEPLVDWELFIQEVSPRHLCLTGPEFLWRDFLAAKYKGLKALNRAHGAAYASFAKIPMPVKETDWLDMKAGSGAIRREFATRNYKHVVEYLLVHGRGVWNTFVFCLLSIMAVLIVNPVAAYAMSRYNLPSTYKILLFLLATMAFPPMVTAIPNFLLLKELHMLNTFWALLLPGIVNGYSIFLLKGFFDSQPRELYEAAQIDGAGEWTLFWQLTMNLSRPILAVIALGAFNAAYGAFMFAFIVCQDESMWTLMVWLYQLQQYAHQSVTFAALLVASVPTFLVFVAAQKVILEGIVIPVEK